MSVSQEELTVRLGLDTSKFEQRLRESDRIAKQYANKAGSPLNAGPMNGSMPSQWSSLGNLSKEAQAFIKGGGGLSGMVNELGAAIGKVSPQMGGFISGLSGIATGLASFGGAAGMGFFGIIKKIKSEMEQAWKLAKEGELLGVASRFMLDFGKASARAGENVEEMSGRLMRFERLIGTAAEGSKEANDVLAKLGVNPWGKTMEENYLAVAEAFDSITDPAERARLAVEAFGRGGLGTLHALQELTKGTKNGGTLVNQEDLDRLELAEKSWRKFKNAFSEPIKDTFTIFAANVLRWTGLVSKTEMDFYGRDLHTAEGKVSKAGAEAEKEKAALAERTAKAAKEKAEAERLDAEYHSLVKQKEEAELNVWQKMKSEQEDIVIYQRELKEMDQSSNEYKDARVNLVKTQLELEKHITEQKAIQEKFDLDSAAIVAKTKQEIQNVATQYNERTKWTTAGILGSDPKQLIASAERYLGRPLTDAERATAAQNYAKNRGGAQTISNATEAAKSMTLLGLDKEWHGWEVDKDHKWVKPGWRDKHPINDADAMAKQMDVLTSAERDPMGAALAKLPNMDKSLTDLLTAATKGGIIIIPKNGK